MPVIATLVRNILLIQLTHGLIGGIAHGNTLNEKLKPN